MYALHPVPNGSEMCTLGFSLGQLVKRVKVGPYGPGIVIYASRRGSDSSVPVDLMIRASMCAGTVYSRNLVCLVSWDHPNIEPCGIIRYHLKFLES